MKTFYNEDSEKVGILNRLIMATYTTNPYLTLKERVEIASLSAKALNINIQAAYPKSPYYTPVNKTTA